jgi:hypothetical protein
VAHDDSPAPHDGLDPGSASAERPALSPGELLELAVAADADPGLLNALRNADPHARFRYVAELWTRDRR